MSLIAAIMLGWASVAAPAAAAAAAPAYLARLPEDEIVYFALPDRFENGDAGNDRGGLPGDRLVTGYDPTAKGFYHGGDLKGLTARLDYVQQLGATAIWVGPVFKNKPVQGAPGQESAGYHGYWITDFTHVDPHFGSDADFAAFVAAAHARGLKVYMDIIVNHTADVIQYRECAGAACAYRSRADYPYSRRVRDGAAINPGFAGDGIGGAANFARLTDPGYAYTPYIPKGEAHAKTPDWLNDVRLYHNRGDTTYWNESATMGDFVGLDDLMTENPVVVDGMIAIYGDWIDRFGVDGFRIDTARHVNPEFWQRFVPAMQARARAKGIPNFHIFGEIGGIGLEPGKLAVHTRVDGFPAVLDFAFRQAVIDTVAGAGATEHLWQWAAGDPLYQGGTKMALQQPTFISNHDNGRFAHFVAAAFPAASDAELLARVELAHAMLLTLRGVPVIYSGDEQGFTGDGGDQDSREDMFASRVASYNDNKLVGTQATTATASFNPDHPLYRQIAGLATLRTDNAALRRGMQVIRRYDNAPGLFAVSRFDPQTGQEWLLLFNTGIAAVTANVEIDARTSGFAAPLEACPVQVVAPGSVRVSLAPLSYAICAGVPR